MFEMEPGSRLMGYGLFAPPAVPSQTFQADSRHTLFGALVQSKTTELDVVLDFPEIPEDCTRLEVRIPKLQEVSKVSRLYYLCRLLNNNVGMTTILMYTFWI